MIVEKNWAGNYTYRAARLHRPKSVEELQEIVAGSERVKILGTRHAFNGIADTEGDLISLEHLNRVLGIDRERKTVTVEAGIRYGDLCRIVHQEGFALHNLASLPHISVAGACATATHGSGDRNGSLATAVRALELVTADGKTKGLARGDADFDGAVVGLGGLGAVTKLTLDLVPAYDVRQTVYEDLPFATLVERFDEIFSGAYSVSAFTGWRGDRVNQVWLKERLDEAAAGRTGSFFGAAPAPADVHPIAGQPPENCTPQQGLPGPWYERLPHFRMEFTPSAGEELQSEYFVARSDAPAALKAIYNLRERIAPWVQISEVRTVAADELWLSPCYKRASVGIHFTWKKDADAVMALLPEIEEALSPFDARPHWGKLFTLSSGRMRSLYERFADFCDLLRRYDPEGKFRNGFLDAYFSASA